MVYSLLTVVSCIKPFHEPTNMCRWPLSPTHPHDFANEVVVCFANSFLGGWLEDPRERNLTDQVRNDCSSCFTNVLIRCFRKGSKVHGLLSKSLQVVFLMTEGYNF